MSIDTTIEAIFRMTPENEGGRNSARRIGYRPHLVVPPSLEYLGVYLWKVQETVQEETILPGETARVFLTPMYSDRVNYDSLVEGAEFEIREGSNTVGTGTVIRRTERTPWRPKGRMITARNLPDLCSLYSVLVVHCGAIWNLIDINMDALLQELQKDYRQTVQFRTMNCDDERNWDFMDEANVINLPALICFINGTRRETLIGMHSQETFREKFEKWVKIMEAEKNLFP